MDIPAALFQTETVVGSVVVASLLAAAVTIYFVKQRRTKDPPEKDIVRPTRWKKVAEVSGIDLYPLKSGAPLPVHSAECTSMGLKFGEYRDRSFLLVNNLGEAVSGKTSPSSVFIRLSIRGSCLTLMAKGTEDLTINMDEHSDIRKASLGGQTVDGICMGKEASDWLTDFLVPYEANLGTRIFLVRNVRERGTRVSKIPPYPTLLRPEDTSFYSDLATPYLLVNEASVKEIVDRVAANYSKDQDGDEKDIITARDFRPNILIRETTATDGEVLPLAAFAEDEWMWLRIGKSSDSGPIFRNGGPCPRCVFTTVDNARGIKRKSNEPLKTLRSFRQFDDPEVQKFVKFSPRFGILLCFDCGGEISVGDSVYVGVGVE